MTDLKLSRRCFLKAGVAGTLIFSSRSGNLIANENMLKQVPRTARKSIDENPGEVPEGSIFISDMSKCLPAENLSFTFKENHWALISYETVEGVKGYMASARPDEPCGELTLPLEVTGFYKIFLGIHASKSHYRGSSSYGQLEVRLSGDPGFRRVGPEDDTVDEDGTDKFGGADFNVDKSITEAYWKTADLSGKSLTFRQPQYPYNRPEHAQIANLTYIRLEPLSQKEITDLPSWKPTAKSRQLALIFCTGQFTGHTRGTYTFHPTSKQWFKDEFEPYRDSDIGLFIFEALRGNSCVYKTNIGDFGVEEKIWQEEWLDPLAEFTRLAHDNGMKIFAASRFIGPQYPMNRAPIAWARYYWKNPHWTMKTKEDMPITNWSLAYPEVRKYWLSLLHEVLAYGIDGIQLHLNRSEPYVFYEEPVVQAFKEKYGTDPRQLDDEDPRWLEHTAGYLTTYIREVRALLDEKYGRKLGVTLSGRENGRAVHYEENQCDVETWIREGLVDYLMVTPYLHESLLQKWRQIGGDGVHIWPDLMPRAQTAASYASLAEKYYAAGADGLCLWDGERRTARISEWAAVQKLGHRDQLDQIVTEGPSWYRAVTLKYLGGFDVKWSFKDG